MRTQIILTLCLLLITPFSLFSCTKNKNPDQLSLKIALSGMPSTLDPRKATDATGMRIVNLLFQSLVRVNAQLEVEGDAAQSWTFKNNTYEFLLKPNLTFHNGRAVSKEDILFSIDAFRAPECPFASAFAPIQSATVTEQDGQMKVLLTVKSFSAKFLSSDLPVLKIIPKTESADPDFSNKPIGSGPMKFAVKGLSQIDLTRAQPLEPGSKKLNVFVFKLIKDDFTRSQKLIKGEVDVAIAEMPPDLVVKMTEKNADKLQVFTYAGLSMTYILVNLKDKALGRENVRRALSQAINRPEIIKYKLMGLATEATSIMTPNNPYFNDRLKNPTFDLTAAKAALKGVQTLSLKTSSNPQAVDYGKVLANQLEKAGLTVKLESYEWGTFYSDIKSGNFQLATMKWLGASDPDVYRIAFHSSELSPGRNRSHYINKNFDHLVEEAHQIQDFEKRKLAYAKIQEIIFEDYVIIPLWYETQSAVLRKNLTGFTPSPLSDFTGLLNVERQEQRL